MKIKYEPPQERDAWLWHKDKPVKVRVVFAYSLDGERWYHIKAGELGISAQDAELVLGLFDETFFREEDEAWRNYLCKMQDTIRDERYQLMQTEQRWFKSLQGYNERFPDRPYRD